MKNPLLRNLVKLIFVTIVVTACTSKQATVYPATILNEMLKKSFAKYEEENNFKRIVLKIEKEGVLKSIKTCNELIKYSKEGFTLSEGINNMRIGSEYQVCYQIEKLRNAVTVKESYLPKPYSTLLIESLDLQTIRSSLKQKLGDTSQTIKDTPFLKAKVKGDGVIIDTEDWFYQFNVLAKGDFNGDGKEDLMIEFVDQAKNGNYFSHETLIVTRNVSDKYLSVL